MARTMAHRFADEIILRLGGGINGIAETKIYFVSNRTGIERDLGDGLRRAEPARRSRIWARISISPRISPDNSRLAFASLGNEGWAIRMFSLDLSRMVAFPGGHGGRQQPIAGVVGGRGEDRVFFGALRASGDLACGCQRRQSAQADVVQARMCRRS